VAKGRFFPWLKPDHKQTLVKPPVSVASIVVDQWRRMAIGGLAFGAVSMVGMVAAGAWAFQKERMPSYTITPIIQPDGWMVETYTDRSDKPLNERIVCGVLRHTIVLLRTVAPGKKSMLQVATDVFTGDAAKRVGRELKALDWYQPMLAQRRTREVMSAHVSCYRIAGQDNAYNIKWRERLHGPMGPIPETERDRTLSVMTTRTSEVPASIAQWNPWGLFITEYSDVLD
jgi:type IV secretory pathway TrbF-like protein